MVFARKATVTTMSSKPCSFRSSTMCSIIGRLAMGIIGLGWFDVSGRRLVPSPTAMTTAFTSLSLPPRGETRRSAPRLCAWSRRSTACLWRRTSRFFPAGPAFTQRLQGDGHVERQGVPAEEDAGDGEHPADGRGRLPPAELLVAAGEEEGEGEEIAERPRLADPRDVDPAGAQGGEGDGGDGDERLPKEDEDGDDDRHRPLDEDATDPDEQQEAVG